MPEMNRFGEEQELIFNFDLKMQEEMMKTISDAVSALKYDVPHKAFRILNALYILLYGGLDDKQILKHEEFKKRIEPEADTFERMLDALKMEFNPITEKFVFDESVPLQKRFYPADFHSKRRKIDAELEEWFKLLSKDMVKLGLIFKKGESPMFALRRG